MAAVKTILSQLICTFLAGLALASAYAPLGWWWMALISLAAFSVLIWKSSSQSRAFLTGYVYGLGLCSATLNFLAAVHVLAAVATIAFMSLWLGLLGVIQRYLMMLRLWPIWVSAAWVSIEYGMSRLPFSGFPWLRLGYTTLNQPLGNFLWLGSVPLASFLVAFCASMIAWIFLPPLRHSYRLVRSGITVESKWRGSSKKSHKFFPILDDCLSQFRRDWQIFSTIISQWHRVLICPRRWIFRSLKNSELPQRISCAAIIIAAFFLTGTLMGWMPLEPSRSTLNVGVVQGNIPATPGEDRSYYAHAVSINHLSETIELAARIRLGREKQADFLLWPENSTDNDPRYDLATYSILDAAVRLAQRPILLGAVMIGPGDGQRQTSALWWDRHSRIQARYDKRNIVPFGEYTPAKDLVFALVPAAKQVGLQTVAGKHPAAMHLRINGSPITLGPIICYELAFDDTVHDSINAGSNISVVQSNNATYDSTIQPLQQLAITQVRAKEMRREVLVATTSSFSAFIDPHGHLIATSVQRHASSAVFTMPIRSQITPALRYGSLIEIVLALAGLIPVMLVIAGRIKMRGYGRSKRTARKNPHHHTDV